MQSPKEAVRVNGWMQVTKKQSSCRRLVYSTYGYIRHMCTYSNWAVCITSDFGLLSNIVAVEHHRSFMKNKGCIVKVIFFSSCYNVAISVRTVLLHLIIKKLINHYKFFLKMQNFMLDSPKLGTLSSPGCNFRHLKRRIGNVILDHEFREMWKDRNNKNTSCFLYFDELSPINVARRVLFLLLLWLLENVTCTARWVVFKVGCNYVLN